MKRQPKPPPTQATDAVDDTADTPEYLATWARALVKEAGEAEARLALAEFGRIAGNKKVPKAERAAAAERAKAIEKYL